MITARRFALAAAAALFALCAPAARAEKPTLTELPEPESRLKSNYEVGKAYTLKLLYTDKDGDRIKSAKFIEDAPTSVSYDSKSTEGNPESGQTIVWQINGFEKGGHRGHFLIETAEGTFRYPPEDKGDYTFSVTSVGDKWILMAVGLFICLGALPFLVYQIARSVNKRGNPSSAARVGLILGIFAALALFIYLFVGIYDPLILALGGVAAVAVLIMVLTRR